MFVTARSGEQIGRSGIDGGPNLGQFGAVGRNLWLKLVELGVDAGATEVC